MAKTTNSYPKPKFLSIVVALIGLVLLVMGGALIAAGGSFYYAIAGLALVACGVMLFRGDRRGAQLYGLFLLGTFAWAVFEVRLDPWALMPRVAMFSVLGGWFLLPRVRRGLLQAEPPALFRQRVTQVTMAGSAVFVVALFAANSGHDVQSASALGTGQVNNARHQ